MKNLNYLVALSIMMIATSCVKKDSKNDSDPTSTTSLDNIEVSQNFNWSSSLKGLVTLNIIENSGLHTDNQLVELLDENDRVLASGHVKNGSVDFYISVPAEDAKVYAHYPNTGDRIQITEVGVVQFQLNDFTFDGLNSGLFRTVKSGPVKRKTGGTPLILSGSFENTTFTHDPGNYNILRPSGDWYSLYNRATTRLEGGSMVFTSGNAQAKAHIVQSVEVSGNEKFDILYDYSGAGGSYLLFYDDNQNYLGYTIVNINGSQGFASFQTPPMVKHIQVYTFSGSTDWVDNFNLELVNEPDSDGDGVPDRKDDYPTDALRAYAVNFPSVGEQILAFEDLWPTKGDYDFNDLVVSNKVEFRKNAQEKLIDAEVTVKVNGMGAKAANGFALKFLDANGQSFSQNMITAVSGDGAQMDPDVSNGVIVFSNALNALSPLYNNNGDGPSAAAQEFKFVVTFSAAAEDLQMLPDFYLFRTTKRGKEIHLSGFSGTEAADASLNGTEDDVNGTYKTANGLPWVVELVYPNTQFFHHPLEKIEIAEAYPYFDDWAISNGTRYIGWMIFPNTNKVYTP